MFCQQTQETGERFTCCCLPKFCAEEFSSRNHRRQYVEASPSRCFNEVRFPAWRPCTSVWVDLREPRFVRVRQHYFARRRLGAKAFDLGLSYSECSFIPFFLESGESASTPCRKTSTLLSAFSSSPQRHHWPHARPVAALQTLVRIQQPQRSSPTAPG